MSPRGGVRTEESRDYRVLEVSPSNVAMPPYPMSAAPLFARDLSVILIRVSNVAMPPYLLSRAQRLDRGRVTDIGPRPIRVVRVLLL
jgi:hypothetical protein